MAESLTSGTTPRFCSLKIPYDIKTFRKLLQDLRKHLQPSNHNLPDTTPNPVMMSENLSAMLDATEVAGHLQMIFNTNGYHHLIPNEAYIEEVLTVQDRQTSPEENEQCSLGKEKSQEQQPGEIGSGCDQQIDQNFKDTHILKPNDVPDRTFHRDKVHPNITQQNNFLVNNAPPTPLDPTGNGSSAECGKISNQALENRVEQGNNILEGQRSKMLESPSQTRHHHQLIRLLCRIEAGEAGSMDVESGPILNGAEENLAKNVIPNTPCAPELTRKSSDGHPGSDLGSEGDDECSTSSSCCIHHRTSSTCQKHIEPDVHNTNVLTTPASILASEAIEENDAVRKNYNIQQELESQKHLSELTNNFNKTVETVFHHVNMGIEGIMTQEIDTTQQLASMKEHIKLENDALHAHVHDSKRQLADIVKNEMHLVHERLSELERKLTQNGTMTEKVMSLIREVESMHLQLNDNVLGCQKKLDRITHRSEAPYKFKHGSKTQSVSLNGRQKPRKKKLHASQIVLRDQDGKLGPAIKIEVADDTTNCTASIASNSGLLGVNTRHVMEPQQMQHSTGHVPTPIPEPYASSSSQIPLPIFPSGKPTCLNSKSKPTIESTHPWTPKFISAGSTNANGASGEIGSQQRPRSNNGRGGFQARTREDMKIRGTNMYVLKTKTTIIEFRKLVRPTPFKALCHDHSHGTLTFCEDSKRSDGNLPIQDDSNYYFIPISAHDNLTPEPPATQSQVIALTMGRSQDYDTLSIRDIEHDASGTFSYRQNRFAGVTDPVKNESQTSQDSSEKLTRQKPNDNNPTANEQRSALHHNYQLRTNEEIR
ncbi:unnamed protein product [Cyprideis torosa]|uniref:Uncharacterized protein n=1 Tax=Cyprideis torosa TaxID=163714 RepID=A0A7R8W394_9CRUS|nr:unnamed protein product [Cyprideis torosa]CAG0881900.1 unnamed protein product [Cyprideis torosa]